VDNLALVDLVQGWECQPFPGSPGGDAAAVLLGVQFLARGDLPDARRRVIGSLRTIARDFADILRAIDIDNVPSGLV
jgi:hypothetical protein